MKNWILLERMKIHSEIDEEPFFEVLDFLGGVLVRSLERHRDRAGLVRACERLPDEGAQQHGTEKP